MLKFIKRLHASEQGAEGLEKLLIIAAIVLPLLAVLLWGRDWITGWVYNEAENINSNASNTIQPPSLP